MTPGADDEHTTEHRSLDRVDEWLPRELTIEEFVAVVEASETIFEVQQATRMERVSVRRLVNELGLRDELAPNHRWRWR